MSDVICPQCATTVNSRGLAGHLRFKHNVKPGKALKAVMEKATPDNYREALTWMDMLNDIRERAEELKWLYHQKKLGVTLEELRKLLDTMKGEYARVLREENIWKKGDKDGMEFKTRATIDSVAAVFNYEPKEYAKQLDDALSADEPTSTIRKWAKRTQRGFIENMRRKHA